MRKPSAAAGNNEGDAHEIMPNLGGKGRYARNHGTPPLSAQKNL